MQPPEMVPLDKAKEDVIIMARRVGLLFYHFARTLIKELGEERGRDLISKAIESYGVECGRLARATVEGLGLPVTLENYSLGRDLPSVGWERGVVEVPGEPPRRRVYRCPIADAFFEVGDPRLGRMYCYVDQAKYRAYNPRIECIHTKNLLDGDECCELAFREKAEE